MNSAILDAALANRKRFVDSYSTEALSVTPSTAAKSGTQSASRFTEKSVTQQLSFYTGNMVDKSDTGFTGLLNQGATCYLNSLVQSLFMTPELRKALYEWQYDSELHPQPPRCIPLQLQKLFATLQMSMQGAIATSNLTTSFGWRESEVYQQHDVLELSQVLFDFLERQAFGSELSNVVTNLHKGEYSDYVQCMVCENMRGRNTPFVGLVVDIETVSTFKDAMMNYITPEILSESNKVTCDECGCKTNAKKGIKLIRLPYFLGINLKRWTFNMRTLTRVKLNNRVTFPLRFDGSQFLNSDGHLDPVKTSNTDTAGVNNNDTQGEKTSDPSSTTASTPALEYELYSMMIHIGGSYGGHYYAYIKDFESGKWCKFNDSKVEEIPADIVDAWFNPKPEKPAETQPNTNTNTNTNANSDTDTDTGATDSTANTNTNTNTDANTNTNTDTADPDSNTDAANVQTQAQSQTESGSEAQSQSQSDAPANTEAEAGAATAAAEEPEQKVNSTPPQTEPDTTTESKPNNANVSPFGAGFDIKAALKRSEQYRKKLEENKASNNINKSAKSTRPKFLDPHGSAYMLMYRLIDTQRNVVQVPNELIPANVAKEIVEADEKFMKQKEEFDRMRQYTTLNVHYSDRGKAVLVLKDASMKDALDLIYTELELATDDAVADVSCIRLRNMKVLNNVPLEPYDDRVTENIREFRFADPKHVMLEVRKADEEFAVFIKDQISLRMIEMAADAFEFKPEVLIQVDEDSTVLDLRAACALQLKVENPERVRLAYCNQGMALLLTDDQKRLKTDERILSGHQIHVELCETHHTEGESSMMKKFDIQLNNLHLAYNKFTEYGEELLFDEYIEIDVRTTIGVLRERLAQLLECAVTELVLRKNFNDLELKDNLKTLSDYRIHTNGKVYASKGRPLQPHEFLFQVFIEDNIYKKKKQALAQKKWDEYIQAEMDKEKEKVLSLATTEDSANTNTNGNANASASKNANDSEEALGEPFLFMGNVILEQDWTMAAVKQFIAENVPNMPAVNRMRLRSMQGTRLSKCYFDTRTLKENLKKSIKDYTQICCQITSTEDEEITPSTLLLYIARWFPARMETGPLLEYPFKKNMRIFTDVKTQISQLSGIAMDSLCVTHPRAYLLKPKNRRKICILDWEMTKSNLLPISTLTQKPWRCKAGQFLLYKDKSEEERFTAADFETGSFSTFVREARGGIKFYTQEEQIQREEERLEKERKQTEVQTQAQVDAIQRLNATAGEAAGKAKEIVNQASD